MAELGSMSQSVVGFRSVVILQSQANHLTSHCLNKMLIPVFFHNFKAILGG